MNTNKRLFSIGEIAKSIGITRRIILNYEDKGLIKPDKKDGITGNRYYTIDTFTQIRTIRVFQNLSLSLDEIREYFNGTADLQSLIKRLEKMRDEINLSIEKLSERVKGNSDVIKVITFDAQTVYCEIHKSTSTAEKTSLLRDTALRAMNTHGTDTTKRMYFIEYPLDSHDEISYCVAVPPESDGGNIIRIPSFSAISAFHHGAYEDIPKTREKLIDYAEEHSLKVSGICRHIYLEGPPQHKDKSKFITQIILPIESFCLRTGLIVCP